MSRVHPPLQLVEPRLVEPRRRPTRVDLLLTVVFLVWGLLEALLENPGGSGWAGVLAAVGYALPLLWRRRFPLLVLLAIGAVTAAYAFAVDVADRFPRDPCLRHGFKHALRVRNPRLQI